MNGVFAAQHGPGIENAFAGVAQAYSENVPLLVIPGGGLNSTIEGLETQPFDPFKEFASDFRVICADLRNAKGGQSTGPLEVERPWDAYTDDQLGLMDHLGIEQFMVLGFCIGGPFIWNMLKRAGDRVPAAVPAQPSGRSTTSWRTLSRV